MCLLVFAHQANARHPLLVAANRDEFHARPTAASQFWDEHPGLLAGRDLEQGGTWMGVTRSGRFAAITNYRDPSRTAPAPRSRGEIPLHYLAGSMTPASYLQQLAQHAQAYAGFNVLVGDADSLWYFTNSDTQQPLCLPPGIYGLSNARLDTPWPKVTQGKARLQALLDSDTLSHGALSTAVDSRQQASPQQLGALGHSASMEPVLSAQFIVTPAYGTRSSTTLKIDADGEIAWREQSFDRLGMAQGEREFVFQRQIG
ncbi:MAG: NRDE family protein [Halioglobus sp.]|nr:NRDE family protein [Halioglobus sp.]